MREYSIDLNNTLREMENAGEEYDCVVPVSGGKDGCFILWYLKRNTDLRLVAYHIDNWYVSSVATNNVRQVCKELNVDLIIYRASWDECKALYRALLCTMGEICIACEYMINIFPLEFAIKNNVPSIAWGLTPNQLVSKHIFDGKETVDYKFYENLVKYYSEIFKTVLSDDLSKVKKWSFPRKEYLNSKFPRFIFPFYYLGYDAEEVENIVTREMGWRRGMDVGGTSSNCIINKLHIYLKCAIKGEEFYENMLENKKENKEVTEIVVNHAKESHTFKDVKTFLESLDIPDNEEQLIQKIKTYKKSIILRKESNISQ